MAEHSVIIEGAETDPETFEKIINGFEEAIKSVDATEVNAFRANLAKMRERLNQEHRGRA